MGDSPFLCVIENDAKSELHAPIDFGMETCSELVQYCTAVMARVYDD